MKRRWSYAATALAAIAVAGLPLTRAGYADPSPPTPTPAPLIAAPPPVYFYQAGWNMVGGPEGMQLPGTVALYSYQSGTYVPAPNNTLHACRGEWGYVSKYVSGGSVPVTFIAPTHYLAESGDVVTCALQPGWNLVGNPFYYGAFLPAGVTGYIWNPLSQQYMAVSFMQLGEADWIYSSEASTLVLTSGY